MGSLGSTHPSSHQTGTAESRQISSFGINFANTIADGETNFNINNDVKFTLICYCFTCYSNFIFAGVKILHCIEFLSKIIRYAFAIN